MYYLKIVIVGAAGHSKGSASVIKSTIWMLKKEDPGIEINLLSYYADIDSIQCSVKSIQFPNFQQGILGKFRSLLEIVQCTFLSLSNNIFNFNKDWLKRVDRLDLLKVYVDSDGIVFCGTDDVSDTYGFLYPVNFLYKGVLIPAMMKKPVIANAAQIGPFSKNLKGKLLRFYVRIVFNQTKLITLRDQYSKKNLIQMNIGRPPSYMVADPAFLLPLPSHDTIDQILTCEGIDVTDKPIVGINLSALIFKYGNKQKSINKIEWYVDLMSQIVTHIIQELNANVVLLPHVFVKGNDDRIICNKVFKKITDKKNLFIINCEYTSEEFKAIIGKFDFFISSRMHPIIHAISMCTPVFGIDYNFKTEELMRLIGLGEAVCSISELTYEELIEKIDSAFYSREKMKKILEIQSKKLKELAYYNARIIMNYLKSREKEKICQQVCDVN